MAGDTSDDFQKELVDLFVQEAQEWLQNIHVALDELQQGPAPERHEALIGILSGGVTNLGGSAATINLPEVEQASFSAIPFIEALKDPHKSFSVQDFLSLCKQLGQIHIALTRATGISFEAGGECETQGTTQRTVSPEEFLQALRTIQSSQTEGGVAERNIVLTMIDQIEAQMKAGVRQVSVDAVQDYLQRLADSEGAFIHSLDDAVPNLTAQISSMSASPLTTTAETCIQCVAQLRTESQNLNAIPATSFFSGLHSLLSVVLQHRISLAAGRVHAVAARLEAVRTVMHQWADQRRTERSAIGHALS